MSNTLRPRLCVLEKGPNGYGFHLHGEKGKSGQFIRLVEPDTPAETSGLRAGDRVVFVGSESVEGDSHQQVVSRIRAADGPLELVVVDRDTDELLRKRSLRCLREYVTDGIPQPGGGGGGEEVQVVVDEQQEVKEEVQNGARRVSTPIPEENGNGAGEKKPSVSSDTEPKKELRPRLCKMNKGAGGYGFNLHTERSKPGQYIRAVDEGSSAEKAGLLPQDRIVQVNGVSVEGKQHSDVVAAIKAGGDETSLLVVDPDTDAFFIKCNVVPTEKHLTGPLPELAHNGEAQDVFNGNAGEESKVSISPSPSSASSNASLTEVRHPTVSSAPPEEPPADAGLSLTMSLQQAKERAHSKRSNKRAPAMDWSKRNELFSNL